MKALILAAGFGVRLREIIHGRPKHLAPINGQPFLRHLLKLLKKRGFKQVVLSVGYLSQYILDEFEHDKEGLKITFSETHRPLGTAGSLKISAKHLNSDFFVINGDTYLDIDYQKALAFHKKHQAMLTIIGTTKNKQGSIITAQNNQVTNFITRQDKDEIGEYYHAGVSVASPKIFKHIPAYEKYSLEKDLIRKFLKENIKISFYPTNKKFIDIGSPKEYQEAITKLK